MMCPRRLAKLLLLLGVILVILYCVFFRKSSKSDLNEDPRCDGKTGLRRVPELVMHLRRMQEPQCQYFHRHHPPIANSVPTNKCGLVNIGSSNLGAKAYIGSDTVTHSVGSGSFCSGWVCKPNPNTILHEGHLLLGRNYRFLGNKGRIFISLPEPAFISGFSLLHPPPDSMPEGGYTSAVREFQVYGLMNKSDDKPLLFGRYKHVLKMGQYSASFPVKSKCIGIDAHTIILLEATGNYGNPDYTAIYKFQIHGVYERRALIWMDAKKAQKEKEKEGELLQKEEEKQKAELQQKEQEKQGELQQKEQEGKNECKA